MRNSFPDAERARAAKSRDTYDSLIESLNGMVRDFNQAFDEKVYHLDPRQHFPAEKLGVEGRTYLLQRRNAFLRIMVEGPGMLFIAFSTRSPSTGDLITSEFNRLILDTENRWKFYRFRNGRQEHVEGFCDSAIRPSRLAKDLLSRLAEISAMPSGTLVSTAL